MRPQIEAQGIGCLAVEDGFLRSVGLGAAFVAPLSLVFDRTGLYYDGSRPSDLETLLQSGDIGADEGRQAAGLRQAIVAANVTKYNVGARALPADAIPGGRPVVLVPGQVADDKAVLIGRPEGFGEGQNVNAILLERARAANPHAFVIFKTHPDVEHLGRAGALDQEFIKRHADLAAHDIPIDQLLSIASRIETYSSLAGFEGLLRGLAVATHGRPFYAGWGLTVDHAALPRRGRRRTLDELAAAALIRYARYWDPATGFPARRTSFCAGSQKPVPQAAILMVFSVSRRAGP